MSPHVVPSLSAYLDGELAAAERQTVESHLQTCDECARHLEAFAAVDELARALPLEAPGGYFEALPARVRFKVTARPRRAPRLPAWSWAVAAALLVAVVTPVLLRQNPRPREVPRAVAPAPPASAADAAAPREPLPTAAPATPEARQKASAPSDEAEAQASPGKLARATPPLAPAPAAPAAAQAPTGGAAQGAPLASNQAAAPLAKAEEARVRDAKDKDGFAQDPGRTPSTRAARTLAVPPEASSLEGAAGQHLYEPKPEADEVAAPAPALQEATAEAKQTGAAGAAAGRRDAGASRSEATAPRLRFRDLESQVAGTAEDARRLREEWRAFVAQAPAAGRADEGRVRVVEMGVLAWKLSNEPADRILARRDAEAYLRRDDAAQGSRVRALLATLGN